MSDEEVTARNRRINFLLGMAYMTVLMCFAVVVYYSVLNEFAKGVITVILGKALAQVDSVFAFEFGTTRAAKRQTDTHKETS